MVQKRPVCRSNMVFVFRVKTFDLEDMQTEGLLDLQSEHGAPVGLSSLLHAKLKIIPER